MLNSYRRKSGSFEDHQPRKIRQIKVINRGQNLIIQIPKGILVSAFNGLLDPGEAKISRGRQQEFVAKFQSILQSEIDACETKLLEHFDEIFEDMAESEMIRRLK